MKGAGAIVLVGGRSRRMGRPKCWLPFGGERMLARVVRRVAEAADPVVVVAATGQEIPEAPGVSATARDAVADRGPLQGLTAGLRALPESIDLAFMAATDMAMLRPAWIERLADLIGEHDLAIPRVGGFFQPMAALYRRSTVLPAVGCLLAEDRMRPAFLVESVRSRIVAEEELRGIDPDLESLGNLNTPDDYRQALARAGFPADDWDRPIPTTVELFGIPKLRAGTGRAQVVGSTIGEALAALADAYPASTAR
ncbi:MAG: molybdenum cofactor guanylyltransferase [Isosphaeraceae bacterium]